MFKKLFSNSKRGFTLVEIMVVVGIIVVLSAIAIRAGVSAKSVARDNQRLADIQLLQLKLEAYRSNNGVYPITLQKLVDGKYLPGTVPPKDPKDGSDYLYAGLAFNSGSPCLTYHLGTKLENNASVLAKKANQSISGGGFSTYQLCSKDSQRSPADFDGTAPLIYDVVSPK